MSKIDKITAALSFMAIRLGCPKNLGDKRTITHPITGTVEFIAYAGSHKSGAFGCGPPQEPLEIGHYYSWEAFGMGFGDWCGVCRCMPCCRPGKCLPADVIKSLEETMQHSRHDLRRTTRPS